MGVGFGNMRSDLPQRPNPKKKSGGGWRNRTIISPPGDSGRLSPEKILAAVRAVRQREERDARRQRWEKKLDNWMQGNSKAGKKLRRDLRIALQFDPNNENAVNRFNQNWPKEKDFIGIDINKLVQRALNLAEKESADLSARQNAFDAADILLEMANRKIQIAKELMSDRPDIFDANKSSFDVDKLPTVGDLERFVALATDEAIGGQSSKSLNIIDSLRREINATCAADKIAREVVADNHLTVAALQRKGTSQR